MLRYFYKGLSRTAFVISSALSLISCGNNGSIMKEPLCGYAQEILENRNGREHLLIEGSFGRNSTGCIMLAGELEQTRLLCKSLVEADIRDNVSGEFASDGLDDFAGEQFFLLYDQHRAPYSSLFSKCDADTLRHTAIELCLQGIDTVCAISPYDRKGEGRKLPAKLIVLDSPYLSSFGQYDVTELFSIIGSTVEIMSPLGCMADKILSDSRENFRIAVFAPEGVTDKEVYQNFLRKACADAGKVLSECFVYHWDGEKEMALASLLDAYSSEGGAACFDAVLCDDFKIDTQSIIGECETINSVLYEESARYGHLISKDITVLNGAEETMRAIYDYLRNTKSFRFRIAPPQFIEYMTTDGLMIPYSAHYIK